MMEDTDIHNTAAAPCRAAREEALLMSNQVSRSLLERLEEHHREGYLSLHMPGHKENEALAPYLARLGAGLDITELPGFDDLHDAGGILKESMERAAALWGSRKSYFQVNGSTGGLLAAVRAATRRGDKVLLARHCHKAIYHAVEICGLEPVFLLPPVEPTFGLAGSVTPQQVEEALAEHPEVKLVVYPSPTYDGVISDTAGICAVAHARGVPVLVDEAHGAHLGFHPAFPPGAMTQGADLAVASLHKMLPSLTQTAILHASGRLVPIPQVARQTGIFQSSSPSYLLMASMDSCVRLLEERGEALFSAWHRRLAELDERLKDLKYLRCPGHGAEVGACYPGIFALDPAKILISTRNSALTGVELMGRLREEYHIELEMALGHYAVAMTGLGTDDAMPARLAEALLALDQAAGPCQEEPAAPSAPYVLPPRRLSMEEAAQAPGGLTFLYDGMGKVCGEYLWAYPPGIPLITPGEEITSAVVEAVEDLYRAGVRLIGTRGKPPFTTFALGDQDG